MQLDLNTSLSIAVDAAKTAGRILKEGCGLREINVADRKDVKLKADVESEQVIRKILGNASHFPIIGEEIGGDVSLTEKDACYWIVDPLDGTFNYLRDFPMTCVSIGLCRGREPILGVIYDFNHDNCYTGADGIALACNGVPLKPAWASDLNSAALATGFPVGRDFSSAALNSFVAKVQAFKKIRMVGSAAMALALVASGRCDAYYEESIRLWDVAAGLALVKSAGGSIHIGPSSAKDKPLAYNVAAAAAEDWIQAYLV